jgi:hypothetical protein
MSQKSVIVSPENGEGFVELARTKSGKLFEKHILNYGELLYPGVSGGKVNIDDNFADTLITNFSNKVCDIVQVPKAGAKNEHTEDPDRNIGEVIGLAKRDGKIYAQIDARDEKDAEKLGKTLLGASAMMHLNYKDTRSGKTVGPTLLHVAVTNRPYVVGLDDYKEIIAASNVSEDDDEPVILTAAVPDAKDPIVPQTREELIAELKLSHNIDVDALTARAAKADEAIELSNKVQTELLDQGLLKLSAGETADSEVILSAVSDAGSKIVELSNRIESVEKAGAEFAASTRIDKLVSDGFILPAKAEASKKLLLSQPDVFDALLPEKPLVALSQESGTVEKDETHDKVVEDEIARLSNIANGL